MITKFSSLVVGASLALAAPFNSYGQQVQLLQPTEALNAAAGFAFTQGLYYSKLAGACAKLPEPMPKAAKDSLDSWKSRNGDLAVASYFWIRYVSVLIKSEKGEAASRDFLTATFSDFDKQASLTLRDRFPNGITDSSVCAKWLELLESPSTDLRSSNEFRGDLEKILAFQIEVDKQSSNP